MKLSNRKKIEWVSNFGKRDSNALKVNHIADKTYTGADNAVRLTLAEPLPAGGVYNIVVLFYAPAVGNEGKGVLTGPGVVLNGEYSQSKYKMPANFGTLCIVRGRHDRPVYQGGGESLRYRARYSGGFLRESPHASADQARGNHAGKHVRSAVPDIQKKRWQYRTGYSLGKGRSQSWRANGSPTLFDSVFAAKQAFSAVIDPAAFLKKNNNY